ncbi:polysaccharide biosynthesis/export family protein [Thiomicrorhabdus sp. 6S3-12]|uniref:polysaccharide biosynthesis/export family protein n=1 Tax=Thiomicrorhabdus sp. 6S3-12 TaxID=2819681 RepID=UPI001AACE491|nr:polysaccharide biosynthesis/export family protein [Thiomicrorhabdus sp. 6S3-12]MBO1923329.1 SLBB domain-containing protein [Thiomicrorhabdus sp. 6S3-12]
MNQFIKFLMILIGLSVSILSQASESISADYNLGSGDVISISVFGEKDLSFDALKLNEKGQFAYPFIGDVDAAGLTARQLQQELIRMLKDGFLKDPKITVSIKEYRQIYVSGAVNGPGGYPYQPGMTVRRATTLAGGLNEFASEDRITVISETDLSQTEIQASMDTVVSPGDNIMVLEYKKIFVTGAVEKPGSYPFQPGLTVAQAAALAGGLTERASESKISVIHDSDETKTAYWIRMNDPIQPGDSITVGEGFF